MQYCSSIFEKFGADLNSLSCMADESIPARTALFQTMLSVSSTKTIFLIDQGSSASLLAAALAKRINLKMEEYRPFKKPGLTLMDSSSTVFTLQSPEAKSLSKVFIQQANNFIHQTTNEGRLLFIDLENTPLSRVKSFLNFFLASCSDCSSPIICSIPSTQLLPLPLRLSTFSVPPSSPQTLQKLLISSLSLHIFSEDSFFNLPDIASNQTLRLTAFFSLFAYSVISLRLRVRNRLFKLPHSNLNLNEILDMLSSLKDLCQSDFQQESLLLALKNCSVSQAIGSQQFDKITSHVFNESYKSFLKRVNSTAISVGKIYVPFSYFESQRVYSLKFLSGV